MQNKILWFLLEMMSTIKYGCAKFYSKKSGFRFKIQDFYVRANSLITDKS